MGGPVERAAGQQIETLRSVGLAAFGWHDRDLDVLDLVFDSLVDEHGDETGDGRDGRRLRFAGHGCTLEVDVHGSTELTVELRVFPPGPVVVESRGTGTEPMPSPRRLVSFVLRWPGGTRHPVRTAWIML
jgi:hypothetical protein